MSSLGENSLPAAHHPILKKETAAAASSIAPQQQQQLPRQVLGNVGNSGINLVQIQQKKEQFLSQVDRA